MIPEGESNVQVARCACEMVGSETFMRLGVFLFLVMAALAGYGTAEASTKQALKMNRIALLTISDAGPYEWWRLAGEGAASFDGATGLWNVRGLLQESQADRVASEADPDLNGFRFASWMTQRLRDELERVGYHVVLVDKARQAADAAVDALLSVRLSFAGFVADSADGDYEPVVETPVVLTTTDRREPIYVHTFRYGSLLPGLGVSKVATRSPDNSERDQLDELKSAGERLVAVIAEQLR